MPAFWNYFRTERYNEERPSRFENEIKEIQTVIEIVSCVNNDRRTEISKRIIEFTQGK